MQVSVVLPAYNCAQFISQAVESVLAQTWRDFELIAIDDGSKDDTLKILRHYAAQDARVKVFSSPIRGFLQPCIAGLILQPMNGSFAWITTT